MTGKVPNLPPGPPTQHIKGRVSAKYNQKFQRWVVRSWPKGNGGITPARAWAQKNFADAAQLIKLASADERDAADEHAANTPFLQRDLLMSASFGNLVEITMADGSTWIGRRVANITIQQLLDSISTDNGAMLVRTDVGWLALLAGDDEQVLTMDPLTKLPKWAVPQGGGGGGAGAVVTKPEHGFNTSSNWSAHDYILTPIYLMPGDTVTSIAVAWNATNAAANWSVGMYAGTLAGATALLANSGVTTGTTTAILNWIDLPSPYTVLTEGIYWIGAWCDTAVSVWETNNKRLAFWADATGTWPTMAASQSFNSNGAAIIARVIEAAPTP